MMADKRGFAVVGLTMAIVIIDVLTAAAVPSCRDVQSGLDKEDRVIANMFIMKRVFDEFAAQTYGVYPDHNAATTPGGQTVRDMCPGGQYPINPFTGCETIFFWNCDPTRPGEMAANAATTVSYLIKACGGDGHLLPIVLTSDPVAGSVAEPTGLGK
jgi:type II secretory pathway pseudopilin PulG